MPRSCKMPRISSIANRGPGAAGNLPFPLGAQARRGRGARSVGLLATRHQHDGGNRHLSRDAKRLGMGGGHGGDHRRLPHATVEEMIEPARGCSSRARAERTSYVTSRKLTEARAIARINHAPICSDRGFARHQPPAASRRQGPSAAAPAAGRDPPLNCVSSLRWRARRTTIRTRTAAKPG